MILFSIYRLIFGGILNISIPILSRQIHIECQSKHNYIFVIYKVLVYVQTSQPTTCFGLFQLGHLQVGHIGYIT